MSVEETKKGGSTGHGSSKKASTTGAKGLIAAVVSKDVAAVKMAIKQGTNVNAPDELGWTPLRKAARAGDLVMVSLLLENGANVTEADKVVVLTAASWGRLDVLRQLLEAKANVADASEWDVSPLVSASRHGHLHVVKMLVEYNVDVNQADRQGNDALMVAWESNYPEIVFYLVEQGGNLKVQDDWMKLAASPATALKISQGIHFRQLARVANAESKGEATMETYKTDVKIPLDALCRWLELVPTAALGLLDKVLFLPPKDGPIRADLKRADMRTKYLDINEWAPKEEPELLELAPKDTVGRGVAVATRVLHQRGILTDDFLFALKLSKTEVFNAVASRALMVHTWSYFVRLRFFMDLSCEMMICLLLFVWWFLTILDAADLSYDNRDAEVPLLYASWGFLLVGTLSEIWDEIRQFHSYNSRGYLRKYHVASHMASCFRILLGAAWVLIFVAAKVWELDTSVEYTDLLRVGYIVMSVVIASRWVMVLSYLQSFESIGPRIIPIIRSSHAIGPFCVVGLIMVVGFAHSAGVLGDYQHLHYSTLLDFWDLVMQRYEMGIMKTVDMRRLVTAYEDPVMAGMHLFWFVIIALLLTLAIGNTLIGLIDEQFDLNNEQGYSQFIEHRARVCCGYILGITASNPMLAPCEKLLQVLMPKMFPKPPASLGYLWACYKIDEDGEGEEYSGVSYQGRLGFVKHSTNTIMDATYKDIHDRIQDIQTRLNKDMKLTQGYLRKTREDIAEKCKSMTDGGGGARRPEVKTEAENANGSSSSDKEEYAESDED